MFAGSNRTQLAQILLKNLSHSKQKHLFNYVQLFSTKIRAPRTTSAVQVRRRWRKIAISLRIPGKGERKAHACAIA